MKTSEKSYDGVDFQAVSREAHQLEASLGARAYVFALQQAEKYEANGERDAANFWYAVYGSLRPRNSGEIPH